MFGRLRFQHSEFEGCVWFFLASIGYFAYDIIFGYVVLYCPSEDCLSYVERPTATFESNLLTVLFAIGYLISAVAFAVSAYYYVNNHFNIREHQFWVSEFSNFGFPSNLF
jgi:hypothetical protein